jgi:SOS-response transcriptional repressor LexA
MSTKSIKKFALLRTKTANIDKPGLRKRLKEIRGKETLQSFGKKIGVAHTTVRRYEEGMIPSPEILLNISRISGKSVEWILTGSESGPSVAPSVPERLPEDEYSSIPLVEGKIAAGEPMIAEEDVIDWVVVHVRPLRRKMARPPDLVACRVAGDSMWPLLEDGDIIVIDRGIDREKILKGRMYAVWVEDGLTVKLLQKEENSLFLIPANSAESVRVVDLRAQRADIVGVVIGGWRNFTEPLPGGQRR